MKALKGWKFKDEKIYPWSWCFDAEGNIFFKVGEPGIKYKALRTIYNAIKARNFYRLEVFHCFEGEQIHINNPIRVMYIMSKAILQIEEMLGKKLKDIIKESPGDFTR